MRKFYYSIIVFLSFLVIFTFPANAQVETDYISEQQRTEVYASLCDAIIEGRDTIDISKYRIHTNNIQSFISGFIWDRPTYSFCIDSSAYSSIDDIVQTIIFKYDDASSIRSRHNMIRTEIDAILSTVDRGWSPIQQLLWINDYICDEYYYDLPTEHHVLDTFLSNKKGVCESYTNLLTALCHELNIPVSYCYSNELQHIWNVVQIDGEWYHFDTTWNDTFNARYNFALVSTKKLQQNIADLFPGKVYNLNSPHNMTSTKYDNAFWQDDVYGNMVPDGQNVYYIKDFALYSGNLQTLTTAKITDINKTRWTVESNYYVLGFNDLVKIGNYIYYNSPNQIFKLSLDTLEEVEVYKCTGTPIVSIMLTASGIQVGKNSNMDKDLIEYERAQLSSIVKIQYYLSGNLYRILYHHINESVVEPTVNMNGFIFTGWDSQVTTATNNTVVYGDIVASNESYTIRFMVDGILFQEYVLNYGEAIPAPSIPTKQPDDYASYEFAEWIGFSYNITATENMTFEAKFNSNIRQYTIKFYDGATKLSEQTYKFGDKIDYPEVPAEIVKNGKTYAFRGWTETMKTASKDATVYTIYAEKDTMYSITYYCNGEEFFTIKVPAGTTLTYITDIPTIENGSFVKWNGPAEGTLIFKDVTIVAEVNISTTQPEPQPKDYSDIIRIGIPFAGLVVVLVIISRIFTKKNKDEDF